MATDDQDILLLGLPSSGTLMIEIKPITSSRLGAPQFTKRIIRLRLDRERARVVLHAAAEESLSIPFKAIFRVKPPTAAYAPLFRLDPSILPYSLSIVYAVGEDEETLYFLAFHPKSAEHWQREVNDALRGQGAVRAYATTADTTETPNVVSSTSRWKDWAFMIPLSDGLRSSYIDRTREAILPILVIEAEIGELKPAEEAAWAEMRMRTSQEAKPLADLEDVDELLAWFEDRAEQTDLGTKDCAATISNLRKLRRLRADKALAFDRTALLSNLRPLQEIGRPRSSNKALDGTRFWAIIIAINKYDKDARVPKLSGCIADAILILNHLTLDVGVPIDHIVVLSSPPDPRIASIVGRDRMHLPKRHKIRETFDIHFRDNDRIQPGDNLIGFFSGHGTTYELTSGRTFQAICPMDRSPHASAPVFDISSYELNALLSRIYRSKSTNITMILDCCYSGGATRSLEHTQRDFQLRSAEPLDIPDAAELILKSASEDAGWPLRQAGHSDMTSHVLLAACQSFETAKEMAPAVKDPPFPIAGVFTFALVSVLSSGSAGLDATYLDLVNTVKRYCTVQTPVAFGQRRASKVWFVDESRRKMSAGKTVALILSGFVLIVATFFSYLRS